MILVSVPPAVGADDAPAFASATEAYRQGMAAIKAERIDLALPALEFAAERGVLGAQLKLAQLYAAGQNVPKNDGKAFAYYQQIADQHAEITPLSPVAKYVAEAFVALGQYYLDGIPSIALPPTPAEAAGLFRHAASYFGDADAQYRLARLYLAGNGVEKNVGLAVNWLATAAKKQHAEAQATLGELLWRGDDEVGQRPARGLALITLAHQNAKASGKEPKWIEDLYREASGAADAATRKEAQALIPELGGSVVDAAAAAKAEPAAPLLIVPASGATAPAPPDLPAGAEAMAPTGDGGHKPAAIGMSSASEPAVRTQPSSSLRD
jgi:uncharacterized protein